ncbi:MAG TPA: PVC-type heme-binding CxxCH protein [Gemmataceae bacterium]|nr:PVC-type heme-binding CxxCH protein [Gemmataceae bacterium]
MGSARAQVPPDKALSTFTVNAEGMELSLWASEEVGGFCNPTCIDVDHKGRVWVCESVNYRNTLHHLPLRRPEGDRILILEDTKGEGKADKCTVFYQSPEILAPLGIAVAKDPVGPGCKVFVCQSPDILVFEDKEGKGHADGPPKKLLTGFGGIDHDHGVHGILIGPDMKLYFSVGDPGGAAINGLQSSDGKGRKWYTNDVDCRAGTIWRCDLDGTNLELLADGFRNEYEPCMDSFGTVFVSDNDDDGSQQTRICYVMPGGDYGYHHPRHVSHWNEEIPGVVPKVLRTYFGAPTGMCFYEGTLFPKKYWGQPLHTDAGPRQVRCYHLTPEGASYAVEREDMVNSTDTWFRPSDICVGPDGSAYIADWYDPGVGGHGIGDWTRGRIYRLAPKGSKASAPKVDLETANGITAALASPNLATRYMAMAKLALLVQGSDADRRLADLLIDAAEQKDNVVLRARALWMEAVLGIAAGFEDDVKDALRDPDPRFRVLAHRLLWTYAQGHGAMTTAEQAINDPSPAVRREVLLLLRDAAPAQVKKIIYGMAKQYDGKDRFYLEAIGIAVGHHDKARRGVILADFEKEFPDWNDKVADLVWELQPPSVMPSLGKRLTDASLTPEQRGRIVDILAASDDKAAGVALLPVLETDAPPEVRQKVIDNLKLYLPNRWHDLRGSKQLADSIQRLLDKPETRVTGLNLIAAAEKTDMVDAVAKIAADGKEAAPIRVAAVQTLGALSSNDGAWALAKLLDDGSSAVRVEAALALGKLAQRKVDQPGSAPALAALKTGFTNKDADLGVRQAEASALAGTDPGSAWLLGLEEKKQLADDVRPDVARFLRNSPFRHIQDKAIALFPPPPKMDLKKLPPIAVLAKRVGDAGKGKALLAASAKNDMQCLKCHTIRGAGGQVGPDLSMIGKKASRENLYESILLPSKAIADQYLQWKIDKTDGLSISGLIVEETPTSITLRDANAKDTKIDKKDIDTRTKLPTSIMPENIAAYMTEDELADVVEYLATLKTPVLGMDWWHIAGPFDNGVDDAGLDKVFPPETAIDLKSAYDGKSGKVAWRIVKPDNQGYVDLRRFFAPESDEIVSYVYRDVDSPADQDATIALGTDDGAKLWVNDKLVFTTRAHLAAVPDHDTVKVRLQKGVNRLLLKINNGNGEHGFYLTLSAEQEVKRVEEK